jgi:hypothetical protein
MDSRLQTVAPVVVEPQQMLITQVLFPEQLALNLGRLLAVSETLVGTVTQQLVPQIYLVVVVVVRAPPEQILREELAGPVTVELVWRQALPELLFFMRVAVAVEIFKETIREMVVSEVAEKVALPQVQFFPRTVLMVLVAVVGPLVALRLVQRETVVQAS